MVDFYSRIFGLVVTDRGHSGRGFEIAFLSRDRSSITRSPIASGAQGRHSLHHQPDLVPGAGPGGSAPVLSVASRRGVQKLDPRNHGNAWSIYFADPEGNRVELYCSSPWHVSQPFGDRSILTEPAAAIRAKTEAMVKQDPTCKPMEVWVTEMRAKMGQQKVA
jgi:catechol 2,3-dioxygenase